MEYKNLKKNYIRNKEPVNKTLKIVANATELSAFLWEESTWVFLTST